MSHEPYARRWAGQPLMPHDPSRAALERKLNRPVPSDSGCDHASVRHGSNAAAHQSRQTRLDSSKSPPRPTAGCHRTSADSSPDLGEDCSLQQCLHGGEPLASGCGHWQTHEEHHPSGFGSGHWQTHDEEGGPSGFASLILRRRSLRLHAKDSARRHEVADWDRSRSELLAARSGLALWPSAEDQLPPLQPGLIDSEPALARLLVGRCGEVRRRYEEIRAAPPPATSHPEGCAAEFTYAAGCQFCAGATSSGTSGGCGGCTDEEAVPVGWLDFLSDRSTLSGRIAARLNPG